MSTIQERVAALSGKLEAYRPALTAQVGAEVADAAIAEATAWLGVLVAAAPGLISQVSANMRDGTSDEAHAALLKTCRSLDDLLTVMEATNAYALALQQEGVMVNGLVKSAGEAFKRVIGLLAESFLAGAV